MTYLLDSPHSPTFTAQTESTIQLLPKVLDSMADEVQIFCSADIVSPCLAELER